VGKLIGVPLFVERQRVIAAAVAAVAAVARRATVGG
jgi:hypothetical protein